MTPVLVFDIETIPDVAGLRRLRPEWSGLSDAEIAEHAFAERRERTGHDFLPLHLHRIVAISCVLRNDAGFRVGSIGSITDTEGFLIQAFFGMIERHTPQLVSWNGGGFDLPVLHYRGLLAGVAAGRSVGAGGIGAAKQSSVWIRWLRGAAVATVPRPFPPAGDAALCRCPLAGGHALPRLCGAVSGERGGALPSHVARDRRAGDPGRGAWRWPKMTQGRVCP